MLLTTALMLVYLCLFFWRPVETEDIWWHLKTGQSIVLNHSVPWLDPFPFLPDAPSPWILTQWLGSVIYYLVFSQTAETGLIVFRIIIILIIFGIFCRHARLDIPWPWLLVLVWIMAYPFGLRSFLRPFLFNGIFIQLFLIILYRHQETGERKYLFWIPLLNILWSNIHLGSFVYGNVILLSFLGSYLIKILDKANTAVPTHPTSRASARERFMDAAWVYIFFLVSFAVSPYGWEALIHPFKVFFSPRYIYFYKFNDIISENYSPIYILTPQGAWFVILFVTTLALILRTKLLYMSSVLLFIFSLGMFFYSQRGSDFFALICGYVIWECSRFQRFNERWLALRLRGVFELGLAIILMGVFVANILHAVNKNFYREKAWHKKLELRQDLVAPAGAVERLKDLNVRGGVFNSDIYGGYLLWHAYPDLRPFVDGRQLNHSHWVSYLNTLKDPERYWPDLEKKHHFNVILLDAHYPITQKFLRYISQRSDWRLIYVKGFSLIYLKAEADWLFKAQNAFAESLPQEPVLLETIQRELESPRSPQSPRPLIQTFFYPDPFYLDLHEEGITLYDLGLREAGIRKVYESLNIYDADTTRNLLEKMLTHPSPGN